MKERVPKELLSPGFCTPMGRGDEESPADGGKGPDPVDRDPGPLLGRTRKPRSGDGVIRGRRSGF